MRVSEHDAARKQQEQRLHRRRLRFEIIRSLLFSLTLALLGNLVAWGYQHQEWNVFYPALLAGVATLQVFWMTYLRRG